MRQVQTTTDRLFSLLLGLRRQITAALEDFDGRGMLLDALAEEGAAALARMGECRNEAERGSGELMQFCSAVEEIQSEMRHACALLGAEAAESEERRAER